MKKGMFLLIALFMIYLVGCCACDVCGYPTHCWKGYFKSTFCGTYVQSPCEKLCDTCKFNEFSCKACWQCMKQDGCGYGDIPMGDDKAAIKNVQ